MATSCMKPKQNGNSYTLPAHYSCICLQECAVTVQRQLRDLVVCGKGCGGGGRGVGGGFFSFVCSRLLQSVLLNSHRRRSGTHHPPVRSRDSRVVPLCKWERRYPREQDCIDAADDQSVSVQPRELLHAPADGGDDSFRDASFPIAFLLHGSGSFARLRFRGDLGQVCHRADESA